jgi:D-alanine-D-alanine ligase
MSTRLRVAVVCGGPSSEAEVSRASAKSIARALEEKGHIVARVELDVYASESLRTGGYDVVFPITHGAVGEDGCLQGALEVLGVPYVGSGVLSSAVAMDKPTAKLVFASRGLPIARGRAFSPKDGSATACADTARRDVGARLVVKPAANGSAIGVARFKESASTAEIATAIEAAWGLGEDALLEHFADGREVTCGVLDVGEIRALPPTEILADKDAFYTYEARYAPGRSRHLCPAPLGDALTARVQDVAVAAHRALGCRDLSRVDFVIGDADDASAVTLLEVNTLPGFTDTSLYPEAAGVAGMTLPELCDAFVIQAFRRGPSRRNEALPLPK